jgi:hypothetical protein
MNTGLPESVPMEIFRGGVVPFEVLIGKGGPHDVRR